MRILLARNWWSLVVRGIFAILLGVLTFLWPGITIAALVLLFGAYALIDGVVNLMGAARAVEAHERWAVLVVEGIIGIAAAIVTLAWPAITAVALVYVIAAWALVTGVLQVVAAIRLRQHIAGEFLLGLAGLASIAFGILLIVSPLAGAVVLAVWIGAYALLFGIVLVALGIRLRSWRRIVVNGPTVMAPAH